MKWEALFFCIGLPFLMGHSWYSYTCCSKEDCKEVVQGQVTKTPEGWKVEGYKAIIPFSDPRIKPSMDVNMHVCQVKTTGYVRCIYVPDPGI